MGPEIEQLILGSEGTLGVITEAVVRIHKLPEVVQYGSIIFSDFLSGILCLRECSRENCLPTSLRLLDNFHLKFGMALSYNHSFFAEIKEILFVKALGFMFDSDKCCFASYLIEGNKSNVSECQRKITTIAKKFGGFNGTTDLGEKAYLITFTVGYTKVSGRLKV